MWRTGTPDWSSADSKVNGVRIGVQSYSFRTLSLDDAIKAMSEIGLGEVELFSGHIEPRPTFSFGGPAAGYYQLAISGNGGYSPSAAVIGDADGDGVSGEFEDGEAAGNEAIINIYLAGNATGTDYGFVMEPGGN